VSAYVVAQITIHDRERYGRYAAGFMPVLQQYGGRLLSADEAPQVMEGRWDRQKLVLIEFPDQDSARRWADSEEYRRIAEDRIAASDGVALLAAGV